MTIKTRMMLLIGCAVVFFIAAPYIVFYSLGYRVNFATWQINGTGGIYVYAVPEPESILIDGKVAKNTGLFSTAVFAQNLMPGTHQVFIKKDGYFDYQKNLQVEEKEVTKLENVTLFKKDIAFATMPDIPATETLPAKTAAMQFAELSKNPDDIFTLKKNAIYAAGKTEPLMKNVVAYVVAASTITWLSTDGFLYESSLAEITPRKITEQAFVIQPGEKYQFKKSPDSQKIMYFNEHQIFISSGAQNHQTVALLDAYANIITDVQWINNDYLVIAVGDPSTGSWQANIIISEIDSRGNINKITMPAALPLLQGETLTLKTPAILLRQQDKKLYIFTQKELVVSERLVP